MPFHLKSIFSECVSEWDGSSSFRAQYGMSRNVSSNIFLWNGGIKVQKNPNSICGGTNAVSDEKKAFRNPYRPRPPYPYNYIPKQCCSTVTCNTYLKTPQSRTGTPTAQWATIKTQQHKCQGPSVWGKGVR